MKTVENKYSSIIETQHEIKTLSDTRLEEEMELKKDDLEKINEERKKAFEELSGIRVVPSIKYLAEMLEIPWSNVEYGIKRVEKLVIEKVSEAEREALK